MSKLWQLSATELAQLVRTRKVSARDAAESALKRLDAVNPTINAIVAHGSHDPPRLFHGFGMDTCI